MSRIADPTGIEPEWLKNDEEFRSLRDLLRVAGRACAGCGERCSAHEAVWGITLGFKNSPRCLPCLARGLGRDPAELQAQVTEYVHRHACYRRAWQAADRLAAAECATPTVTPEIIEPTEASTDLAWDAGDTACGELVLALRLRLAKLPAGAVLFVRATDPAAREDIPAWCRLTGHPLVSADHPAYRIRRKEIDHAR